MVRMSYMGFPVWGLGDLAYFIEAHRASVGFREPLLSSPVMLQAETSKSLNGFYMNIPHTAVESLTTASGEGV